MVTGARIVPEKIDDPEGGVRHRGRAVASGRSSPGCASSRSPVGRCSRRPDRFSATVNVATSSPSRRASEEGFLLFQSGASLWRSERWLAAVAPLVTSPTPNPPASRSGSIASTIKDRPTGAARGVRRARAARSSISGRCRRRRSSSRFAAIDAWRAVAIADMRGVVVTSDAGATWRPVSLPIDAREARRGRRRRGRRVRREPDHAVVGGARRRAGRADARSVTARRRSGQADRPRARAGDAPLRIAPARRGDRRRLAAR